MKNRIARFAINALALLILAGPAFAGSGSFSFTRPTNKNDRTVKITERTSSGALITKTKATITPGMTAEQKRDAIKKALEANGYTVTSTGTPPADPGITISGVRGGRKLWFDPGATGEAKDSVTVPRARHASVSFDGVFDTLDWDGSAATFTAGIITDHGEVSVTYRAEELGGAPVSGDYLAGRLFSDLYDAASDLGAQLTLDGSTILVDFDAGAAQGDDVGLIFGTTSPSKGLSAGARIEGPVNVPPGIIVPEIPASGSTFNGQ